MERGSYGWTGMQISRHWRLKSQRYRLEGVRYQNGEVSLQNRPATLDVRVQEVTPQTPITGGSLATSTSSK